MRDPSDPRDSRATCDVRVELHGAVAVLVLDDERRKNAMTPELGDALRRAVSDVRARRGVRAVVLTGAGDAFSAGGDLAMLERLRQVSKEESRATMLAFYGRYLSILELEVPTIAAVRGPAIGAGLAVALACDLLVCDEDAKLAANFAKLGLYPGMGTTFFLERRAGVLRAAELVLTGRRFSGRDALAWGLANDAVPAAEVLPRARALAEDVARSSPATVRALKARLAPSPEALREALEHEATRQSESYQSADLGEGLAAARERRAAVFEDP
ncbi:MAG TPA: enoyl-CoA hydratase/isomerase family protein [Polyangiaceae bacterium]|nr:enoyl-CoA hydratase/isomerase family protein [Polyangiaceae bacterium]